DEYGSWGGDAFQSGERVVGEEYSFVLSFGEDFQAGATRSVASSDFDVSRMTILWRFQSGSDFVSDFLGYCDNAKLHDPNSPSTNRNCNRQILTVVPFSHLSGSCARNNF